MSKTVFVIKLVSSIVMFVCGLVTAELGFVIAGMLGVLGDLYANISEKRIAMLEQMVKDQDATIQEFLKKDIANK